MTGEVHLFLMELAVIASWSFFGYLYTELDIIDIEDYGAPYGACDEINECV